MSFATWEDLEYLEYILDQVAEGLRELELQLIEFRKELEEWLN